MSIIWISWSTLSSRLWLLPSKISSMQRSLSWERLPESFFNVAASVSEKLQQSFFNAAASVSEKLQQSFFNASAYVSEKLQQSFFNAAAPF